MPSLHIPRSLLSTLALAATVCLAAAPTLPLRADEARPLSVQLSDDGSLLVVADPARDGMAMYRINGNTVTLIAARDVARDMRDDGVAAANSGPPSAAPTKDAAGQDPPEFERPEGYVRIGADYSRRGDGESWQALYLVRGSIGDLYAALRKAYGTWNLTSERVAPPPFASGSLRVSRGITDLGVSVQPSGTWDGFVQVRVEEARRPS